MDFGFRYKGPLVNCGSFFTASLFHGLFGAIFTFYHRLQNCEVSKYFNNREIKYLIEKSV